MNIVEIVDIEKDKNVYETLLANICEALAYNKGIQKGLDKLYEEYKYTAYKKAKYSGVYNHLIFTQGDLEKEVYCKKALGLILIGEEDERVSNKLIELIKRYYYELNTAVHSKSELALQDYFARLIVGGYLPSIGKANEYLATYLIIKHSQQESFKDSHKKYIDNLLNTVGNMEAHSAINIDTSKLVEENKEKLNSIFKRIVDNKGYFHCYEDIYNSTDEDIKRYETIISLIFDFEKISISNLLNNIELLDQDIYEIILAYTMLYKDKNLERTTNILINGIIIKSLLKAYKGVKEAYFKNNKETLYLDFESLENTIKELKSKNIEADSKIENLSSQVIKHQSILENEVKKVRQQYNRELTILNKQIKDLEKDLERERKNKIELDELREMLFRIENNHNPESTSSNLEDLIGDKKIMVVGGTPEWKRRLKDRYPQILTLDGFTETFDSNILKEVDFVFFYVGYMNHGTYYKVVNVLKNRGIPFKYIGKTNIELVEDEIGDELQRFYNN